MTTSEPPEWIAPGQPVTIYPDGTVGGYISASNVTVMPAEQFDQLAATLDEPDEPNELLIAAARTLAHLDARLTRIDPFDDDTEIEQCELGDINCGSCQ